jgi:hypothetical protein
LILRCPLNPHGRLLPHCPLGALVDLKRTRATSDVVAAVAAAFFGGVRGDFPLRHVQVRDACSSHNDNMQSFLLLPTHPSPCPPPPTHPHSCPCSTQCMSPHPPFRLKMPPPSPPPQFTDYHVRQTSRRVIRHGVQVSRHRVFHPFDFGFQENLRRYGTVEPPPYQCVSFPRTTGVIALPALLLRGTVPTPFRHPPPAPWPMMPTEPLSPPVVYPVCAAPCSRASFGLIDVPVNICAGTLDTLIPEPNLREMAAALPGSTYSVFPNRGHLDFTIVRDTA